MSQPHEAIEALFGEDLYVLPQKTVVVIPTLWEALPEEEIALLGKILTSVHTSLDAVSVISSPTLTAEVLTSLATKRAVLFGSVMTPAIPPYTATTLGTAAVIQADALSALDDARKKQLWKSLKEVFGK